MASHPWPSLFATRRRVWFHLRRGRRRRSRPPRTTIPHSPAILVGTSARTAWHTLSGMTDYRRPGRHLEPRRPRRRRRPRRLRRPARRGRRALRGVRARPTPAASPSLDGAGLATAMAELGAIADLVARAAQLRAPALRRRHRGRGERRARREGLRARDRDRDEARVLRPRVGRGRRRDRRRADRGGRPGARAPPPAHDPPLPPAPAQRGGGEAHGREVRHRARGLVAALQRADERDPRRPAGPRRARAARDRA